jgi:TPR repeat protein
MDFLEADEFVTYYYRSPAPERVTEALQWFVSTPDVLDPKSAVPMGYFFGRVAQEHPSLIQEYRGVLRAASPQAKPFVSGILAELAATPPGPVNALQRPILTATDNDLLWAEFMLTGSEEPIVRLIDVLARPDVVRAHLEAWLAFPLLELDTRLGRIVDDLRFTAGIVCDLHRGEIRTQGDLDCRCLMQGLALAPTERVQDVRDALPFELTDEDVTFMGAKASAKWSLASNANRHLQVLRTCEAEVARRSEAVGAALREIIVWARENQRDFAEAMKLRQAALNGAAEAQCRLGIMYDRGVGVPRLHKWAVAWFQRAAMQGFAEAEYRLGASFYYGQGVEENEAEAAKWLRKAAAQGHARAQYLLGEMSDGQEAASWFRQAAEQGLAEAQYRLGVMYLDGDTVRRDELEAVRWYGRAAEQGLADGQYALGDMYYQGWGVQQDPEEAAAWLRRAAEQGDTYAQEDLAEMLALGTAAPQGPGEIAKWSIAADSVARRCPHCSEWIRPHLDGTCGLCRQQIAAPDGRTAAQRYQAVLESKRAARRQLVSNSGLTLLVTTLVGVWSFRSAPLLVVAPIVVGLVVFFLQFARWHNHVEGYRRAVDRDPEVRKLARRDRSAI